MTSFSIKPWVRFALELEFPTRSHRDRLLTLYGDRFFQLIHEAKSKKYFSTDYNSLEAIRQLLVQHSSLESLVPVLSEYLDDAGITRITEVAPLFDAAPRDLKAYLLMSLGMRVYANAESK